MRDYALLIIVLLSVMELVNLLTGGTPDDLKIQTMDLLMPLGALILILQYIPKFIHKLKDSHFRSMLLTMIPLVALLFVLSEFSEDSISVDRAMEISIVYVVLMSAIALISKYLQYRKYPKDKQITESQSELICEELNNH